MKKKSLTLIAALSLALSLTACGGGSGSTEPGPNGNDPDVENEMSEPVQKDVDLSAFYDTLQEETEWPAMVLMEGEALDAFYPGLTELSPRQCLVNTAAISAAVGEIALVELENAEDAQTAADIFQARIDYQVGDESNPGAAMYPMTIEGWQTSSQIVTQGNYVMLAVGDNADDSVERFNALFV